jgi:16S rRNA (guanine527-N7)-methyltransferase
MTTWQHLPAKLATGLTQLSLPLNDTQQQQLLTYLQWLHKWNKAINLTSITEPEQMLVKHLFDSLAVVPHLQGDRILDVGTGAGLPGIPLAIACPDKQFVLLDKTEKKTRFITQVAFAIGLKNLSVVTDRVENHQDTQGFSTIISRAVSSTAELIQNSRHLCSNGGRWLAMKSTNTAEEVATLPYPYQQVNLKIPGLDAVRTLICVEELGCKIHG